MKRTGRILAAALLTGTMLTGCGAPKEPQTPEEFRAAMIGRSVVSTGNTARLNRVFEKAENGGDITIATVRNGKYRRLFSCTSLRVTRLTANAPDEECFYGNATGRVLLAEASPELRTRIIGSIGLPSSAEWPEAAGDLNTLLRELKKIREQGFAAVFRSQPGRCFIAAGCANGNAGLPVAVGISVPQSGFDETKLLELLRQALRRLDHTTHP